MPDGSLTRALARPSPRLHHFLRERLPCKRMADCCRRGTSEFNSTDLMLARFLANGVLDTSFSSDGSRRSMSVVPVNWPQHFLSNHGRLSWPVRARDGMAVARVLASGELDTSFSTDGWFTRQVNRNDKAYGLARQANGQILVVGTSLVTQDFSVTNYDMSVTRVNTNGTVDAAFGFSGTTYAKFQFVALFQRSRPWQSRSKRMARFSSALSYGNFDEYTVWQVLEQWRTGCRLWDSRSRARAGEIGLRFQDIVPLSSGRLLVSNYQGVIALIVWVLSIRALVSMAESFSNGTCRPWWCKATARLSLQVISLRICCWAVDGRWQFRHSFSRDGIAVAADGAKQRYGHAFHSATRRQDYRCRWRTARLHRR